MQGNQCKQLARAGLTASLKLGLSLSFLYLSAYLVATMIAKERVEPIGDTLFFLFSYALFALPWVTLGTLTGLLIGIIICRLKNKMTAVFSTALGASISALGAIGVLGIFRLYFGPGKGGVDSSGDIFIMDMIFVYPACINIVVGAYVGFSLWKHMARSERIEPA